MNDILIYRGASDYSRWVELENPDRLPFVRPRCGDEEIPKGVSIWPEWKLCISAVVRADGQEFAYWHEHNLWAGNQSEALAAARRTLELHPGLLGL